MTDEDTIPKVDHRTVTDADRARLPDPRAPKSATGKSVEGASVGNHADRAEREGADELHRTAAPGFVQGRVEEGSRRRDEEVGTATTLGVHADGPADRVGGRKTKPS